MQRANANVYFNFHVWPNMLILSMHPSTQRMRNDCAEVRVTLFIIWISLALCILLCQIEMLPAHPPNRSVLRTSTSAHSKSANFIAYYNSEDAQTNCTRAMGSVICICAVLTCTNIAWHSVIHTERTKWLQVLYILAQIEIDGRRFARIQDKFVESERQWKIIRISDRRLDALFRLAVMRSNHVRCLHWQLCIEHSCVCV